MKKIIYPITTDFGAESVDGEACEFTGLFGAQFGVHENARKPEADLKRWAVTHIETGFAIAYGPTKKAATFSAEERLKAKGEKSFREGVAKAMKRRAEIESEGFSFAGEDI